MSQFEQLVLPLYETFRKDWLVMARAAARQLGQGGQPITVDMVRAKCPPPDSIDPRVMGAIFTRKEWENCGYIRGYRSASHGRPVATFRLRAGG